MEITEISFQLFYISNLSPLQIRLFCYLVVVIVVIPSSMLVVSVRCMSTSKIIHKNLFLFSE